MKKLLALIVPMLALIGCANPLSPDSRKNEARAAKAKASLHAATANTSRSERIAAN